MEMTDHTHPSGVSSNAKIKVSECILSYPKLTWGTPLLVMTKLSTAVRATCVDATIVQKEH